MNAHWGNSKGSREFLFLAATWLVNIIETRLNWLISQETYTPSGTSLFGRGLKVLDG